MKSSANSTSTKIISGLTAGLFLLGTTGIAAAQDSDEKLDAEGLARTPLNDLNIDTEDIPEVLLAALNETYSTDGTGSCSAIGTQVAELDNALGKDLDEFRDEDGGIDVNEVAQGLVESAIPFRGLIRRVSGAKKKEALARAAFTAGMVRRGYLKGLGQQRGCKRPARPKVN